MEEDPSQLIMIVAKNSRKCYMVNPYSKRLCWTSFLNDNTEIYEPWRVEEVNYYMEAKVIKGKIRLYHYNPERKHIEWKSDLEFGNYVTAYYGDNFTESSYQTIAELDRSGNETEDGSSWVYQIRRKHFHVRTTWWGFEYSEFQAFVLVNGIAVEIDVYHAYQTGAFSKICQRFGLDKVEEIASEIWFQNITPRKIQLIGDQVLDENGHVRVGQMGRFQVAVKTLPRTHVFSAAWLELWRSHDNPNIRMFLGAQMDNHNYRLAFEFCPYTLPHYVKLFGLSVIYESTDVFRGLLNGLAYLHEDLEICHNNLTPWNVLVTTTGVTKISGLGSCTKHNTVQEVEDLKALGKSIAFCYSPPRAESNEEEYVRRNSAPLASMYGWAYEAEDIAAKLLAGRASLRLALEHLWLYQQGKRNRYIGEAVDFIQTRKYLFYNEKSELNIRGIINKRKQVYFSGNSWRPYIPDEIIKCSDTKHYYPEEGKEPEDPKYNYRSPCSLFKFMRNNLTHYSERVLQVKEKGGDRDSLKFLGDSAEATELSFRTQFPRLVLEVYNRIKDEVKREEFGNLAPFYVFDN